LSYRSIERRKVGALPRLLDSHLEEQNMSRERFAELCCEQGWTDTKAEALSVFDASTETFFYQINAAEHVLGLGETGWHELKDAAFTDARERRAENLRNRAK
jgi:hypothetical protein